jgi:hypothetical protein
MRDDNWSESLTSGMVGAVKELWVCADLLKRGHHVFRAVSPSCPYDLVASIDGNLYRVEVTTGFRDKRGILKYNSHPKANRDLLAVVGKAGEIYYEPMLSLYPPIKANPSH